MSVATAEKRYLATKVPEITLMFWVIKLWTTGMGEATSDFLGDHSIVIAAVLGISFTLLALRLQLRQEEYRAGYYWFVVAMIAVVGTMIADAIHDGLSIPYSFTTAGFGVITAVIFWRWYRSEGTLSIHTINTRRREWFYWVTVFFSFALGTAAGDLTATSLNLGFLDSIFLFSGIMLIPLIGWWKLGWNPIFTFWFAYVDTRPIGASFSDWFSKPHSITGLNFGDGPTALVGWIVFLVFVVAVALTKHGIQAHDSEPRLQPILASEPE
ncbi:MAG TPA: hypothetical protein VHV75_13885 [Solirubrobacteraceae bacterium]|jgi:uncharacterized membrane-anchored protein|nr:hypothetical protein [Solirubrobacteraceae bacterium]